MTRVEGYGHGYESPFHLSWGAIIGGAVVSLGLWMLLHSLGLAAGLSAVDPNDPGSLRGAGIGTGVFSIIAPLVALFGGGYVASRTAGIVDRGTGVLHGVVMWALTAVAGAVLVLSLLATLAGAGLRLGGAAVSKAVEGGGVAAETLGVDVDDVLGPINQRLQAQGLPPVTSQQLQAATRQAAAQAVREGRVDRQLIVQSVAQNTNLAPQEAQQVANRIADQWSAQLGKVTSAAQRGALKAADVTGKAFWGIFFALLLGMLSAAAGSLVGVSRRQRYEAEVTTPGPERPVAVRQVPIETRP
jgi:hypothetical protein